jgi:predicted nucleic acid-binding protein
LILLDTSVLSRVFRRRHPGPKEQELAAVLEGLMTTDVALGLPGIVLQEVLSGIRGEKQFVDLQGRLLSAFRIVHPSTADHVQAARLRNRCLARGLNVSGIDCLIATVTVTGGHELFAVDGDFAALARHAPLKLFSMPPPA